MVGGRKVILNGRKNIFKYFRMSCLSVVIPKSIDVLGVHNHIM